MFLNIKNNVRKNSGVIACYVLAFACLFASIYHTKQLLNLYNEGLRAEAVVVGIKVGAKGSKTAIYEFNHETRGQVRAKDIFQMYFYRHQTGDEVTVIYNPLNKNKITADIGLWNWQGTVIFGLGFIFLIVLGILILRFSKKD